MLARSGIKASGPRLGYLMMHAELEAIICSGPREGRQFTYSLLETRVPAAPVLKREAALTELSRRYFTTRGPATAQDFAMWSGLTLTDARAGLESLGRDFARVTIAGQVHAFRPVDLGPRDAATFAFLMPDYDEYGMSYKDRRALATSGIKTVAYNRMIVVDGRIVGSWRRSLAGKAIAVETDFPVPLSRRKLLAVAQATRRFTAFAG